jgi:hypothetical protein
MSSQYERFHQLKVELRATYSQSEWKLYADFQRIGSPQTRAAHARPEGAVRQDAIHAIEGRAEGRFLRDVKARPVLATTSKARHRHTLLHTGFAG